MYVFIITWMAIGAARLHIMTGQRMAIYLGVDTGGTYTDAVLIEDGQRILASAKSLTTRHDLAQGVGAAVRAVLDSSKVAPDRIALASLSTTLATNALVEGQGGGVALVYIGFRAEDLGKHGLLEALQGDPHLVLSGGHNHAGGEARPLDTDTLQNWLSGLGPVSGFAVASQFATRNPAHELAAADLIRRITGRPVTMSHELSAQLNGPKRAVTAVLNARLIGMIDRLIGRAEDALADIGIRAPLMVVRGDGALMASAVARTRPIETILSGPAASIVGAQWLSGARDAIVSDIGGTTTDIAILRDGKPALDPNGAQVGGFRTMVEAVAMRTHGLGGDSEVHIITEGLQGGVRLGPRRVLPVSLAAHEDGDVVHTALERQLRAPAPSEHDARFIRRSKGMEIPDLPPRDAAVLDRIGPRFMPLGDALQSRMDQAALTRLWARGLVQISALTPTDAVHALGRVQAWDSDAACKALDLMARRRIGSGDKLAADTDAMAQIIVDQMTRQTRAAILSAALDEESGDFGLNAQALCDHPMILRALEGHRGLLALDAAVNVPVIGLGASAHCYYPAVGQALNAQVILQDGAEVANAIGAVVGQISVTQAGTITSPSEGKFRVHLPAGPEDFAAQDLALQCLWAHLRGAAQAAAIEAGAEDVTLTEEADIRTTRNDGRDVFIEATLKVTASGRPRIEMQD